MAGKSWKSLLSCDMNLLRVLDPMDEFLYPKALLFRKESSGLCHSRSFNGWSLLTYLSKDAKGQYGEPKINDFVLYQPRFFISIFLLAGPKGVSGFMNMDVYSFVRSASLITGWWSTTASYILFIPAIFVRKFGFASVKHESFTIYIPCYEGGGETSNIG